MSPAPKFSAGSSRQYQRSIPVALPVVTYKAELDTNKSFGKLSGCLVVFDHVRSVVLINNSQ
jgi:hypothetical protein